MMGLGTGRRGMKSPPLLIAVLLACVFVLGINYWITSSRCVELQTRVMDLEGRMRRAAAERGAVEMKKNEFEDMLAKQKSQIDNIQSLHSSQMQNFHLISNREKESLLYNLTSKDNLIHTLQVQITNLHKRLEDSKLEFKELQESQARKSSYELTQCSNKITEMNEQCEEKLRRLAAKDGNTVIDDKDKSLTKYENPKPTIPKQEINQKDSDIEEQYKGSVSPGLFNPAEDSQKQVIPLSEDEGESNKLDVVVNDKKPSPLPQQPKLGEAKKDEDVQETQNEVNPDLANAVEEDDEPKVEDTVDKDTNKETENEEVERENLINMDQQEDERSAKQNEQDEVENQNDYNGDEANEAEPEADKQAQLIDNDQNLKDDKIQNGLNGQAFDQEAEDSDDPTVK